MSNANANLVGLEDYEFMQRRLALLEALSRGERAILKAETTSRRGQAADAEVAAIIWTNLALDQRPAGTTRLNLPLTLRPALSDFLPTAGRRCFYHSCPALGAPILEASAGI